MINTYVHTQPKNNVSYVLTGIGGNSVRFNFEHGNIITKKLPELTLRGKYYQELLENSELYKNGLIRKVRSISEPSDNVAEEKPKASSSAQQNKPEEVRGLRTSDEVIAYINNRFDKECKTLATAMKHASKANLIFPDFNE